VSTWLFTELTLHRSLSVSKNYVECYMNQFTTHRRRMHHHYYSFIHTVPFTQGTRLLSFPSISSSWKCRAVEERSQLSSTSQTLSVAPFPPSIRRSMLCRVMSWQGTLLLQSSLMASLVTLVPLMSLNTTLLTSTADPARLRLVAVALVHDYRVHDDVLERDVLCVPASSLRRNVWFGRDLRSRAVVSQASNALAAELRRL
jgi:hypothetical protein